MQARINMLNSAFVSVGNANMFRRLRDDMVRSTGQGDAAYDLQR
jgi:hypothetical protein